MPVDPTYKWASTHRQAWRLRECAKHRRASATMAVSDQRCRSTLTGRWPTREEPEQQVSPWALADGRFGYQLQGRPAGGPGKVPASTSRMGPGWRVRWNVEDSGASRGRSQTVDEDQPLHQRETLQSRRHHELDKYPTEAGQLAGLAVPVPRAGSGLRSGRRQQGSVGSQGSQWQFRGGSGSKQLLGTSGASGPFQAAGVGQAVRGSSGLPRRLKTQHVQGDDSQGQEHGLQLEGAYGLVRTGDGAG